jgi:hypothetical protein
MTIYLPTDKAALWGNAGAEDNKTKWYVPVRFLTQASPGYRCVRVPKVCCEGGWFHPDRHEDLPALAELLS